MAQLSSFDLPESNLNVAVDEIVTHLNTRVDNQNRLLFPNGGGRGLYIPGNNVTRALMPDFRVWYADDLLNVETQQLYFTKGQHTLELFLYFYEDWNPNEPDMIQVYRQRFVEYILKGLQHNDGAGALFPTYNKWQFVPQQQVLIDHTNAFKRHGDSILVLPPNFVTLVEIGVQYQLN